MSAEAWLVETASMLWVYGYEQDAADKVQEMLDAGEECELVRLVPDTEVEKCEVPGLRAEVTRLERERDDARDLYRETEERLARERTEHDKTQAKYELLVAGTILDCVCASRRALAERVREHIAESFTGWRADESITKRQAYEWVRALDLAPLLEEP